MPWINDRHWHNHTSQVAAIHKQLDDIKRQLESIMFTKEEVRAELDQINQKVTETRGYANSALQLLKDTLARVNTAAAAAEDLEEFRDDLKLINEGVTSMDTDFKAAVTTNP